LLATEVGEQLCVGEPIANLVRKMDGQRRLADPWWPVDGDNRSVGRSSGLEETSPQLGQLASAAGEVGDVMWQLGRDYSRRGGGTRAWLRTPSEQLPLPVRGNGELLDRPIQCGRQPPHHLRLGNLGPASPAEHLLLGRRQSHAVLLRLPVDPLGDLGERKALLGDGPGEQLGEWTRAPLGGHMASLRP
jgi:hypothetical protein